MHRCSRSLLFVAVLLNSLLIADATFAQPVMRGVTSSSTISGSDIADLAEWGANVVRYPLFANDIRRTETEAGYYAWLEEALLKLDEALPNFETSGVRVIVSLHSPPGGVMLQKGTSVYRMFIDQAWAQQAIVVAWSRIATRYANRSIIWGYDTLNEPQVKKATKGFKDWNQVASDIAYTIRGIDSQKYIIVESVYGNPSLISRLKTIPLPGMVYSVHMYYPLSFQHQGLYGNRLGVPYPSKKLNKKALAKILSPAARWARKKGVPMYIGEFSAVRWAPGNSSYLYMQDVIDIMESYGWHWTYHSFRESHPWSVEHSNSYHDLNESPSMTDREMLLRQYFDRN